MEIAHEYGTTVHYSTWPFVFRRWKLALFLSLCLLTVSLFVIFNLPRTYTASVQLLLPFTAIEDPAGQRDIGQTQADMFVVRSYSDVAEDDGVCLRVIDSFHLAQSPEFQMKPSLLAPLSSWTARFFGGESQSPDPVAGRDLSRGLLLQAYKSRLTAKNDAKSLILTVAFKAASPYLAAKIVDAHVAAFVDAEIAYRRKEDAVKTAWMKSELDGAEDQMRAAQNSIQLHEQSATASVFTSARDASDLRFKQILVKSKQTVYETLLARYQSSLAEQKYIGSDIRVLSQATIPIKPSFPKPLLFGAAAAFASMLIGFAAATTASVLLERPDLVETASALGLPILGSLRLWKAKWRLRPRVSFRRIQFWESIRGIRSSLGMSNDSSKVILVTSAASNDGTSLLAASLARSVAASGSRTLLLDLNFRKPSFYAPKVGGADLRAFFAEGTSITSLQVPFDTKVPLYFAGVCVENGFGDVDVFGGPSMRALIDEAKSEFDAVIIDTPAIDFAADALFVADLADEVILIASQSRRAHTELTNAVNALRSRHARLKGVVISDRSKPGRSTWKKSGAMSPRDLGWPTLAQAPIFERMRNPETPPSSAMSFARAMAKRLP